MREELKIQRKQERAARNAELAAEICADREARGMPWPAYSAWMGVKHSTLYKIAMNRTTKPHEGTVEVILSKLAEPVVVAEQAESSPNALVSDGQQRAE